MFEEDLKDNFLLSIPEIYQESQKQEGLSLFKLLYWYLKAVIQSVLVFYYVYFDLTACVIDDGTFVFDYSIFITISAWIFLFAFTMELFFNFRTHSWVHFLFYFICVASYVIILFIYSLNVDELHSIIRVIFSIPRIWLIVPSILGLNILIEVAKIFILPLYSKSFRYSIPELEWLERNQSKE